MSINLGTQIPSDYKFGSAAVSAIYLGINQVWPAAVSTKLAISRNNGSATSFLANGADGTSAHPFARAAAVYYDDAEGMLHYAFTLTANGTVFLSCNCADETDSGQTFSFKRTRAGATTTFATSGSGGSSPFTGSSAGLSGDIFTIVANSSSGSWASELIDTVSVYAT